MREVLANSPETVNATDKDGRTALHFAASTMGSSEVVTTLINAKANVNAADKHGATPLHFAACGGDQNVAWLLILAKANVKAQDENGCAPVHFAAVGADAKLVDMLMGDGSLSAGFCADKEGRCAIHWAADAGRLDNVRVIVGAHMHRCLSMKPKAQRAHKALMVNMKDMHEQTPLAVAKEGRKSVDHRKVVQYLLKHGGTTIETKPSSCCSFSFGAKAFFNDQLKHFSLTNHGRKRFAHNLSFAQ